MNHITRSIAQKALALSAALVCLPLAAQGWPVKPVRMIVPNTPGGATDVAARLTSPRMTELLGQTIVVENRIAAGGVLGTNQVAKSPPDGYTLIMVFDSFATNPFLFQGVEYDAVKSFAPVSLVVRSPQVLVAHPSLGARDLREMVRIAKEKGEAFNFATAGPGTSSRFSMELFRMTAGIEPTAVHYKGGGALVTALVGGQVPVSIVTMGVVHSQIRAGKLIALAVTTASRSPLMPDVPPVSSVYPGFEAQSWTGLLAPAGTPRPVIDALHGAMSRVLALPDVRDKFQSQGYEVVASTPEAFGTWIREESVRWGRVIRERKITLE